MQKRRDKGVRLEPSDWIEEGTKVLASKGVDAIRVEDLARRLRVSKGSFYWHFRDREELLDAILESWESEQKDWDADEGYGQKNPAERWARLLELVSGSGYGRRDTAIFNWAQQDDKVARRASEVEAKRIAFVKQVFREVGFSASQAEEWAEAAMLLYLGWVNRATRDPSFGESGPSLADVLSRFVLAASALSSQEAIHQ